MKPETVELIASALQRAARSRTLISYPRFHRFFEPEDSLPSRYAALAEALRQLSDWPRVDYGALLARDNGLPGDDFFDRIRRNRPDDYAAAMGTNTYRQSLKRKRQLVDSERERVYEHAQSASRVDNST